MAACQRGNECLFRIDGSRVGQGNRDDLRRRRSRNLGAAIKPKNMCSAVTAAAEILLATKPYHFNAILCHSRPRKEGLATAGTPTDPWRFRRDEATAQREFRQDSVCYAITQC